MRSKFSGYYPPTEAEMDDLWSRGTIVLDTNALLSLMKYSEETREDFFEVLEALKDRLWIPYHVGHEFHENRHEVAYSQGKAFEDLSKSISKAMNEIAQALEAHPKHPSFKASELRDLARSKLDELTAVVEAAQASHKKDVQPGGRHDQILERITELFDNVGEPYDVATLTQAETDAQARYEKKMPPGFKDAGKTNGNQYGDYIIWRQILDLVEAAPAPVIFVTDDVKDDWWLSVHGQTKGPRPELVKEFFDTCGERIHFFTSARFLQLASQRFSRSVEEDVIREVREVSESRVQAEFRAAVNRAAHDKAKRPLTQSDLELLLTERKAPLWELLQTPPQPAYDDMRGLRSADVLNANLLRVSQRLNQVNGLIEAYGQDDLRSPIFDRDDLDMLVIERGMLERHMSELLRDKDHDRHEWIEPTLPERREGEQQAELREGEQQAELDRERQGEDPRA